MQKVHFDTRPLVKADPMVAAKTCAHRLNGVCPPMEALDISDLRNDQEFGGLDLADGRPECRRQIDVLIGLDNYWNMLGWDIRKGRSLH